MRRALPPTLVALTPGTLGIRGGARDLQREVARLLSVADAAIDAGLRGILLREPALGDRATLALGRELSARLGVAGEKSRSGGARERAGDDGERVTRPGPGEDSARAGIVHPATEEPSGSVAPWLALHDRVHLAESIGADAVHLGFRSLPSESARRRLEPGIALGRSLHAWDPAGADEEWLDYAFFGPVFATPSKRGLVEPVGLEGLRERAQRETLPLWALGGIEPGAASDVLAAGARGLAVLRPILASDEAGRAVRAFAAAIRGESIGD